MKRKCQVFYLGGFSEGAAGRGAQKGGGFSEGLRELSEWLGIFLAMAAWYGTCRHLCGILLAFSEKTSAAQQKNLCECRLSPLEGTEYLNI